MSDQALSPETLGVLIMWGGVLCVLSGFVAWLASQKGRSGGDWFLLSLVFSPLLTFIFVAVAPKAEKKEPGVLTTGQKTMRWAFVLAVGFLVFNWLSGMASK